MADIKMKVANDFKENTAEAPEFSYGQILTIFLRHRLLFIGVLIAVLGCFVAMTLRKPATYMSSMQLLIEPNSSAQDPLAETPGSSSGQSQQDYATQLNLMRSNLFIDRLLKNLHSEYPNISSNEIQSSLTIEKVLEGKDPTKIIKVTFISDSSRKTLRVLTYLQALYQNYNRNQQVLKLTEGLRFIDNQLEVSRRKMFLIQNKIENYRKKNGLFDPLQQVVVVNSSLNQVEQEIRTVQTQRREMQARDNALKQQLNVSPKIRMNALRLSQSVLYQKQLASIKETEQELSKQRVVATDDNPIVKNLIERRQRQINLLKNGAEQILGSSDTGGISNSDSDLLSNGQLSTIDQNIVNNLSEIRATLESLDAREKKQLAIKQQLRRQLDQFPSLIAGYQRLQPEAELEQSVLKKLLEQRQDISSRLSRGGFTWQVVEPPLEGNQIGPDHKKDILLGVVVGVFLASGAVFLLETVNKNNQSYQETNLDPILPILGFLPAVNLFEPSKSSEKYSIYTEGSIGSTLLQKLENPEFRDAVDLIYRNVQLYNSHNLIKSLMITSPLPGEGKTTLVLGLALRMARSGLRVLVIDTDFDQLSFQNYFEVKNRQGLSNLLLDKSSEPIPEPVSLLDLNIDIVPSGFLPKSSSSIDLLTSNRMKELIRVFTSHYDFVLLDTSSALNATHPFQFCDASILISQLSRLNPFELYKSILSKDLKVLGLVENKFLNRSLLPPNENENNLLEEETQSILMSHSTEYCGS
jgi:polysaccharide biosynthesis transport protein